MVHDQLLNDSSNPDHQVTYSQVTTTEKELIGSLRKSIREREILLSISCAIAGVKDRPSLLHVINSALKQLFYFSHSVTLQLSSNAAYVTAFLLDPSSLSRSEPNYMQVAGSRMAVSDGIIEKILVNHAPLLFDIEKEAQRPDAPDYIKMNNKAGLKELLAVTLRMGENKPLGIICFYSDKPGGIQKYVLDLVQGVACHLSTAMANILHHEEIKRRDRENEILLGISNALSSVKDKSELSGILYERLREMFHYDEFVIAIMDESGASHYPYLHVFADDSKTHPLYNKMSTVRFAVHDGFFDQVILAKHPVVFDLEKLMEARMVAEYLRFDYDNGIREIVAMPLVDGNKTLGAFFILLKAPGCWNQPNLRLVQGISYQLSIAIANLLANAKIETQLAEINNYKQQLEEEKLYLQKEAGMGYSYHDIIGSTPQMHKVFHLLSQVSFTHTTVLLLGETGTGKELIARAIHNSSPRKDKMMVKVNCAALPANLIESELFGHERGSFTGATERRLGKFELANNGTLFLDEIGDMPLDLQVKLLRAIQEREIERVGGKATIKVNVRLIAATNRNLQKEVDEGRFRSDLYYRLNVFPITLPSLREHKEDIPALASHFLNKYTRSNGRKPVKLSGAAMKQMMAYHWPGNVRELEHLIERSILMSTGNTIHEMHLPKMSKKTSEMHGNELRTHEENERDYIIQVLNRCHGKIFGAGGAAEIMDMKVSTLNSRMKKLGIRKEQTVFKKT